MSFETAEILRRRAEAFLKNAEDLLSKGVYDLSAFNIHQFSELYLKYLLYFYAGDYSKTHSIKKLLKDLRKVLGREEEIMKFIDANVSYLSALEAVYLTSRYQLSLRILKSRVY